MTNELNVVNAQGEVVEVIDQNKAVVVEETDKFIVKKNPDGKYKRYAKFHDFQSFVPADKKEKLWLANALNSDEDTGNGLRDNVGKVIVMDHVITRSYDRINEDTGERELGVLTYIITPERDVYVTSSKSVYFYLDQTFDLIGRPGDEDWEPLSLKVIGEKGENGTIIKVKFQL